MEQTWGYLRSGDNYLVVLNNHALIPYSGASGWSSAGQGLISGTSFVKHLQNNVSTFITVSKFDTVMYTPDIPYALARLRLSEPSFAALVSGIGYDRTTQTVPGRPGQMGVFYVSSPGRNVAMPFQYVAGHSITQRTPAELLADVLAWYQQTPH